MRYTDDNDRQNSETTYRQKFLIFIGLELIYGPLVRNSENIGYLKSKPKSIGINKSTHA